MRVDLPAPLAPTMACTSPGRQSSETSRRTVVPKNRLVIASMARTGSVVGAVIKSLR